MPPSRRRLPTTGACRLSDPERKSKPRCSERWVARIDALEEKKRHYETILRRELDGLDDEFSALQLLSQELAIRARGLRFQKAA